VDWFDYVAFSTCMDGPGIPPDPPDPFTEEQCLEAFDSEVDGDIDLADFAWFTTVFEG